MFRELNWKSVLADKFYDCLKDIYPKVVNINTNELLISNSYVVLINKMRVSDCRDE
jgi:hypothetical protein